MINAPRGVEDLLHPKSFYYAQIEKEARDFFSLYGYEEIRIPTFERTELFLRSVGEETDVGKQMYTFKDRGGRSISLRPEGTAGVARAYVEHKLYGSKKEWKVYYMGPMFRYEKPQMGRLREFYQIGVECFGEKSPWLDVEIIEMAYRFLSRVRLTDMEVQINSIGCKDCRGRYVEVLKDYLKDYLDSLCDICKRRYHYNVLRVLDCKNPTCRSFIEKAPQIKDYLCSSCEEHFNYVKKGLENLKIKYTINPYLVRGLDYYTRTIFEIISPHLGAQSTVCAGGRYDDLVSQIGGPSTPAMGFAIGLERLVMGLKKEGVSLKTPSQLTFFIAMLDQRYMEKGMQVASLIRSTGAGASVSFKESSLSSQLRQANKKNFSWVIIIGEEEIQKKKFLFRNMRSGKQYEVSTNSIEEFIKNLKGVS